MGGCLTAKVAKYAKRKIVFHFAPSAFFAVNLDMISKIFISNRGEIACRIARTAHRLGIHTCGVYTPQDSLTKHVRVLEEVTALPAGDLSQNYLNPDLMIQTAQGMGADALHPGY